MNASINNGQSWKHSTLVIYNSTLVIYNSTLVICSCRVAMTVNFYSVSTVELIKNLYRIGQRRYDQKTFYNSGPILHHLHPIDLL